MLFWQNIVNDLESFYKAFKFYIAILLHLFFSFMSIILSLLCILIRVAFMVLLERKVLGYIQLRKGPNKSGYIGIIQSIADAVKLFVKEQVLPLKTNKLVFLLSPCLSLFIVLSGWLVAPKFDSFVSLKFSGLLFFCCLRFSIYPLIFIGWSSNSNYSLIGAIRGISQTISYEASLSVIFISIVFMSQGFSLIKICIDQYFVIYLFLLFPMFLMWFISILAEANRTPFDFSEGESELVSGFNIEYGRAGFALIFLAEYGSIILLSFVTCYLFFGYSFNYIFIIILGFFFCYLFIWVRGCYPRFRYDKLIDLAWKIFLPSSIIYIFYLFLFLF